jgi:hypothetical protein
LKGKFIWKGGDREWTAQNDYRICLEYGLIDDDKYETERTRLRWNRFGGDSEWDPVVQTLVNVVDTTKLKEPFHGCTRLLKTDTVAFDNTGTNNILNGAGSLDLSKKLATIEWVVPLKSNP